MGFEFVYTVVEKIYNNLVNARNARNPREMMNLHCLENYWDSRRLQRIGVLTYYKNMYVLYLGVQIEQLTVRFTRDLFILYRTRQVQVVSISFWFSFTSTDRCLHERRRGCVAYSSPHYDLVLLNRSVSCAWFGCNYVPNIDLFPERCQSQ